MYTLAARLREPGADAGPGGGWQDDGAGRPAGERQGPKGRKGRKGPKGRKDCRNVEAASVRRWRVLPGDGFLPCRTVLPGNGFLPCRNVGAASVRRWRVWPTTGTAIQLGEWMSAGLLPPPVPHAPKSRSGDRRSQVVGTLATDGPTGLPGTPDAKTPGTVGNHARRWDAGESLLAGEPDALAEGRVAADAGVARPLGMAVDHAEVAAVVVSRQRDEFIGHAPLVVAPVLR